jgi:polysaccharide chain length determinant protein (PEP-CTERM system associated)
MKEQLESLLNIIMSAWRFRWAALLVAASVCAFGVAAVLLFPGRYESQAEIYVDSRSVLRPLLKGLAVTDQTDDDSDVVREALLARPTLIRVAQETGLYGRATDAVGTDKLLLRLAQAITIHGDGSTGLYTIAYDDPDAPMAQSVVKALLETFVANSVGATRSDTRDAEAFLAQQVATYEQRLSQAERKLADFKKRNIDLMPNSGADYFGRLQAALTQRDKLRMDIAVAMDRRNALRGKITTDAAPTPGTGARTGTAVAMPTDREILAAEALDARIRSEQAKLNTLLENYTDRYPTVVSEKGLVKRLQTERQTRFGNVKTTAAEQSANSLEAVDPVVQDLQVALNNADLQVTTLKAQSQQVDVQIAQLQKSVTIGPEIEAELARLTRDYGVNKAEYDALLQRLEAARISNEADRSEELRFKVLEPPRVPLRPYKPNKRLLLIAVLFAALATGAAVAVVRAMTHPVFYTKAALGSALKLPVIGRVSQAYSSAQIAARSRESLVYGSAAALLFVIVMVAVLFEFSASQLLQHLITGGAR